MGPNKAESAERIKWEWIGPVYCEESNPTPPTLHVLFTSCPLSLSECRFVNVLGFWGFEPRGAGNRLFVALHCRHVAAHFQHDTL